MNRRIVKRRHRRPTRQSQRRGAEIVELAFALPVMSVLVFGTLELCEVTFTKQSLVVATYEASRLAGRPSSNTAMVEERFNDIMAARRVTGSSIVLDPPEIALAEVGQTIRITASAPVSSNSTTNLVLTSVPDIVEEVVVLRE